MSTVQKLRELLVPVLGADSAEEIKPEQALVKDLGADSIDFVEIIYLIEQNFGVVLKTSELIAGGVNPESLFVDGRLTAEGAALINKNFTGTETPYKEGMTKVELFSAVTVQNLADIIDLKIKEKG